MYLNGSRAVGAKKYQAGNPGSIPAVVTNFLHFFFTLLKNTLSFVENAYTQTADRCQ